MNDKTTYLITARPIDRYFFGSERSFVPADGSRDNYLVRSNTIPQQTTLMGLVRYAVLKNLITNDTLKDKSDIVKIGNNSFDGNEATSFGVIENISPLFLMKNGKNIEPAGLNCQRYVKHEQSGGSTISFSNEQKGKTQMANVVDYVPRLKEFEHKQKNELHWQDAHGTLIKPDEIFGYTSQPGNQKSYTGQAKNDAFFKQTFCYLKNGYCFAFYLTTNEVIDEGSFRSFMGGDGSEFKFTIQHKENHFKNEAPDGVDDNDLHMVTLISDSFIPNSALQKTLFSINELKDFRYLQTKTSFNNYADIDTKANGALSGARVTKSRKTLLAAMGSVFYVTGNNLSYFIEEINKQKAYQKIGYNYFKHIKIPNK